MHEHDGCKHESLKYCQYCDVVYCEKCHREWYKQSYYYSPYIYPYTYPYNTLTYNYEGVPLINADSTHITHEHLIK